MSMKRIKLFLAAATVLFSSVLNAQDGAFTSYSPYSVFGVGNMSRQGNAYSLSMGGVGIASRSNRFINIMNPAAVTARDTLSFMLDFGLSVDNRVYRQGDVKSAKNLFNISNFTFSVPIWKKSALYAGITPYSSLGYDFSHSITDRIVELAERYEDTLPALSALVDDYEARVKSHLERMGFVW